MGLVNGVKYMPTVLIAEGVSTGSIYDIEVRTERAGQNVCNKHRDYASHKVLA